MDRLGIIYAYSAYGEAAVLGPDGGNSLRYTGREDDGTGLYHYRARYYDAVLKRFAGEDPIGLEAGPNAYAFVEGNPILKTDPTGLSAAGMVLGTASAAGAAYAVYRCYAAKKRYDQAVEECKRQCPPPSPKPSVEELMKYTYGTMDMMEPIRRCVRE